MWFLCMFFFSSRRRHTRYWRDWSSDVCSSDLGDERRLAGQLAGRLVVRQVAVGLQAHRRLIAGRGLVAVGGLLLGGGSVLAHRSEERRVGKECRSRWSPYH